MIEIISKGTKSIVICNNCGCKFSFEHEDVVNTKTELNGFKEYVPCPQCNKEVIIRQSK